MTQPARVLIVADNVSARFGGEAFLPLHYFTILRARGVEAWLVTHERVRAELLASLPHESSRFYFVDDTAAHKLLWRASAKLPERLASATLGMAMHVLTAFAQRRIVRDLVRRLHVSVVHQPTPVSPRTPSALFDVDAPVVIGPLNGGMTYPPSFQDRQPRFERQIVRGLRAMSTVANQLLPGKPRASVILVANERTRRSLPGGIGDVRVVELVENGVDLERFVEAPRTSHVGPTRFAFVGRLVHWKGIDLLLEALAAASGVADVRLEIFGDGDQRLQLEAQTAALGLGERVRFHGFVPQAELPARLAACDVLVLPSLYECGGAVVLEAMAMGLPVLATAWGGPADYLDPSCGVLVEPGTREAFIEGLRDGMVDLARSPARRLALGAAARSKVKAQYDWDKKVDRMLEIYGEAAAAFQR
jgi:glycosyltransferase involved in cell wall biosynthesis